MCCIPLTAQRLQELTAAKTQAESEMAAAISATRQNMGLLNTFATVNESMVAELTSAGLQQLVRPCLEIHSHCLASIEFPFTGIASMELSRKGIF